MALEAARTLVPSKSISLMQLQRSSIHKAISFLDENAHVETLFCSSGIQQSSPDTEGQSWISADFVCYGCLNKDVGDFSSMASVADLGYGYQGMFQGITDLRRTSSGSKGMITIPHDDGEEESMLQNWAIHPATLDVAFQAVFAAVGAPGDGRLWTLHVPTMIDSITVNPSAYEMSVSGRVATPLPFDAFVVGSD